MKAAVVERSRAPEISPPHSCRRRERMKLKSLSRSDRSRDSKLLALIQSNGFHRIGASSIQLIIFVRELQEMNGVCAFTPASNFSAWSQIAIRPINRCSDATVLGVIRTKVQPPYRTFLGAACELRKPRVSLCGVRQPLDNCADRGRVLSSRLRFIPVSLSSLRKGGETRARGRDRCCPAQSSLTCQRRFGRARNPASIQYFVISCASNVSGEFRLEFLRGVEGALRGRHGER